MRSAPAVAKKMGAPASARSKVAPKAKMTSTGSAKKTTVSRGSKTAKQMGNQNQIESTRVNKNYPNKTTTAEAKQAKNTRGPLGVARKNEATPGYYDQRAGGGKNLSYKEMMSKRSTRAKASRGR